MGSAVYHFKAVWPKKLTKAVATKVNLFMLEAKDAYNWWQDHRGTEAAEFWPPFKKQFPHVHAYLFLAGKADIADTSNGLSGILDINPEGATPAQAGSTTVRHSAEVWHMGTWDHLEAYFQSLGASYCTWLSEEYASVGDLLDTQEDSEIVSAILAKPLEDLPSFLGIHPVLDARIAGKLSK